MRPALPVPPDPARFVGLAGGVRRDDRARPVEPGAVAPAAVSVLGTCCHVRPLGAGVRDLSGGAVAWAEGGCAGGVATAAAVRVNRVAAGGTGDRCRPADGGVRQLQPLVRSRSPRTGSRSRRAVNLRPARCCRFRL
ncbi:hypothetical protein HBB16_11220 [Pseudonocardia sp. MCCB 268]|nr:hypothetical protein [Pseudonocardia cytotoxica]